MNNARARLFREEALKHRAHGGAEGELLRLSPAWIRWTFRSLVAAFFVGIIYSMIGRLHEYASGPAVVWISGRTHVTAAVPGTVASIEVRPGQRVEAGQLLVLFSSAVETAELARIDREFELELAKSLIDPANEPARAVLTALRAERQVAAARLEQLSIRAPHAGTVGDVRIRPGQLLAAGDVVLALTDAERRHSVVAMMPAHYRPQLHPGLSARFEVEGYRYSYQEMPISSVATQIIGPKEVKRYLGQDIQDTFDLEGPVVLIEATPRSNRFTIDGEAFEFYHGMNGRVEVRVRSESILVSLVPGLRTIFGRSRDE